MDYEYVRARAGNTLLALSEDGFVVYVSVRPRGLDKRIVRAARRLRKENAKRSAAIAKAKGEA